MTTATPERSNAFLGLRRRRPAPNCGKIASSKNVQESESVRKALKRERERERAKERAPAESLYMKHMAKLYAESKRPPVDRVSGAVKRGKHRHLPTCVCTANIE